jgi:general secretion pathway protein J
MNRASNQAGFTLIELLVTVTLLSFLALLLFGGLRFGVRAWEGAQAHGESTDDLRIVQNLLRRTLEQAYPRYDASDPIHPVVDFRGQADWVTFLAPAPQSAGESGRSRITLAALREGGDMRLVIRGEPELAAGGEGAWSSSLLRNLAAARFSYFAGDHWRSDWTDAGTMPSLVRLHIEFRRGDGRVWPDLVVAPRIEEDVGCIYDVTTQHCQGRP